MIVMYLITQEDTAATLLGLRPRRGRASRIGLGAALLAWMVALDIAWLRIACFVAFLFVGLVSQARAGDRRARVRDRACRRPLRWSFPTWRRCRRRVSSSSLLWLWLCVTLGLTVNLGVQLLLCAGRPVDLAAA